MISYQDLEACFERKMKQLRQGHDQPPPEEALGAPVFFDNRELRTVPDSSIRSNSVPMPFPMFWIVTPYRGLALIGLIETEGFEHFIGYRPDMLFYIERISGQPLRTSEADLAHKAAIIFDYKIAALTKDSYVEVESETRTRINRGRAKSKKALPKIPSFIRITGEVRSGSGSKATGQGSEKSPHDRRGHWRTYKASGKQVWIPATKIKGGATSPQRYVIEA